MAVEAQTVKELRERTGLGLMDCKKALAEAGGDIERAIEALRKSGLAKAVKRSGREVKEGRVFSYIHHNGRVGVLLVLNCESDFVARNEEFAALGKGLCLQVASTAPMAVRREEIPPEVVAKERDIFGEQVKGKPGNVVEKIVEGKLEKFYEERCLLDQPFVKDDGKKVKDLVQETAAKLGENVVVGSFARFEV
jgi:elongation factor Ts